jgi:S-adenosylhomocysteine hydrolase
MFPKYSVIEQLQQKYNSFNPEDFYIISVQHLLESTGSMFEAFINIGFKPENIFLTGKLYSTNEETKEKLKLLGINVFDSSIPTELGNYAQWLGNDVRFMWQKLSETIKPQSKIIVLDDGGYTAINIPENILTNHTVFGIEQTTSGAKMVEQFKKFPIIDVAKSAAKVIIEPPIVSESITIQLGEIIAKLMPHKIGIIGYGHIGKAVAKELKSKYQILVYDNVKKKIPQTDIIDGVVYCNSANEIYNQSDVLIGATGQDISDLNWLTNSTGDKTLISVSSGDIEFQGLLKECKPYLTEKFTNPTDVLNLKTKQQHKLTILRGGMVANFTGTQHSSPGEIIQMTRGLLFSAVIQILRDNESLSKEHNPIMLAPEFQKEVVAMWFKDQPKRKTDYSEEDLTGFNNIEWIKKNSTIQ